MKKISTLFKKDPNDLSRVINEVNPENQWVVDGEGIATRKFDGTACAVIDGFFYKRYDVKKGRPVPVDGIPCQDPDEITGHWPHWVPVTNAKEDKYFMDGWVQTLNMTYGGIKNGTYELIGPKIQGNPEKAETHMLIKHGDSPIDVKRTWDAIKSYLSDPERNIEGIVFHHPDGRMCKIRKSDFGVKR